MNTDLYPGHHVHFWEKSEARFKMPLPVAFYDCAVNTKENIK